jgi:hypothetical protein
MPKAWKPTFSKISLEQLKNHHARSLCNKICKVDPIYPTPNELYDKYFKPGQVGTCTRAPEVVEPEHEFQPILPELWQPWMAREIMSHQLEEVTGGYMDYVEAMERRDKVTDALIVLRSEAAALNMQDVLAKISTAGAAILDELWEKGDLGD